MGFRTGAFAKVWEVSPVSDVRTKLRMSISRKNKQTGEYETEWDGFAVVCGTAPALQASKLARGDVIRLGDVDATRRYDKEKSREFTDWKIFSFTKDTTERQEHTVDDGEPNLPF